MDDQFALLEPVAGARRAQGLAVDDVGVGAQGAGEGFLRAVVVAGLGLCLDAQAVQDGGGLLGVQDAQPHEVVTGVESGKGPDLGVGDLDRGERQEAVDVVPAAVVLVGAPHAVREGCVAKESADLADAAYMVQAGEQDDVSRAQALHLSVLTARRPPEPGGSTGVELLQLLALRGGQKR
ncbi:hypothetical protein [Streptomyces sp. NPDC050564]|uniref:hypothetical protein n=1 Tax=Streptomyces sp. NPDC050564 TaxID=3365631 RepID=UPI0037997181